MANLLGGIKYGGRFAGYDVVNKSAEQLPQSLASAVTKVLPDATPIWFWGTLVANGTNHLVIVKDRAGGQTKIKLANINIPIGDFKGENAKLISLVDAADLYGNLKEIFDNEMHKLLGVEYKPIAYMGEQVVKGLNHYILCEANPMTLEAEPYAVIVVLNVFQDNTSLVYINEL